MSLTTCLHAVELSGAPRSDTMAFKEQCVLLKITTHHEHDRRHCDKKRQIGKTECWESLRIFFSRIGTQYFDPTFYQNVATDTCFEMLEIRTSLHTGNIPYKSTLAPDYFL